MPTINDPLFGKDSNVTLKNPTGEDFTWTAAGKPYRLPAGAMRMYQGYVADLCVKHFVDKMMNEASKDDPNVEKLMTNYYARQEYVNRIVVREESVTDEVENEGIDIEADEGVEVDEKDIEELDEKPMTPEDLEKETKSDEEIYPDPKKHSNIVEDEDENEGSISKNKKSK